MAATIWKPQAVEAYGSSRKEASHSAKLRPGAEEDAEDQSNDEVKRFTPCAEESAARSSSGEGVRGLERAPTPATPEGAGRPVRSSTRIATQGSRSATFRRFWISASTPRRGPNGLLYNHVRGSHGQTGPCKSSHSPEDPRDLADSSSVPRFLRPIAEQAIEGARRQRP